ncbi:MAG: hypothetical protein ABSH47_25840 [Bryobacteraceae bacterium]|jgi:hypothetical protein
MEPKSKMVSFRLSPSEYAEAEEACRARGYRSIALYARCAILAFHSTASRSDAYEEQIRELRERVDTMAEELIRLSAHVGQATKRGSLAYEDAPRLYETARAKS